MFPRLVITKHKQGDEKRSEENHRWQHFAVGSRDLDPCCDLPSTPVSKVINQETSQGCEVFVGPNATSVFLNRLNTSRDGGEDDDADEEGVK